MAKHAHITSIPAPPPPREDFDQALTQSRIIVDILKHLADATISYDSPAAAQSLYAWLIEELAARLERIEVADMIMARGRI